VSCDAVFMSVLKEELFPQNLVKLGNVEFYEYIFSVFGAICAHVEGQKMQDVQVQSDPAF